MKRTRPRVDINLTELNQMLDHAVEAPLSQADCQKLKSTLQTLVELVKTYRNSEKTKDVLPPKGKAASSQAKAAANKPPRPGHGRNAASDFSGAKRIKVAHATLHSGDACPGCARGKVYQQKEPKPLVRIMGQAPLTATVYELERLRCNACGEVFTAEQPAEAGPDKYSDTTAPMIALLKYGSGVPFNRLENLQQSLGIPLPAATQWELVEEFAEPMQPAGNELIRQGAQGGVLHNDDTGMRVLRVTREPSDKRTGVFTTGIVSIVGQWKIALFFTGSKHAGENIAQVLKQRAENLPPPIQMCDALSRNMPKLAGVKILLAHCLAHGRRQIVDQAENFPEECQYVLDTLGSVYHNDELARERALPPEERLSFHQEHSAPLLKNLREWMNAQLDGHKTEPNSGLGKALSYLLKHWKKLTLFLSQPGAPIDNNIVERSLKKAILNRKNALFYKTLKGAQVGDLFMSLIHTCELNGVNPFDYLVELQRHKAELAAQPSEWMPWNYRETLLRLARGIAA
jgi:transposase